MVVEVAGIPSWVDHRRLLGAGEWRAEHNVAGAAVLRSELDRREAADLSARLRNVCIGGSEVVVTVIPRLKRALVRAARADDARRRRQTTGGFTRPGVRTDSEGQWSLTPEPLAMAIARPWAGRSVTDLTCGLGGNAIAFARAGCAVLAVDTDSHRLALARHNAGIYGVNSSIIFLHGRAEEVAVPSADLVFVDPPWGTDWDRSGCSATDFPLLVSLSETLAAAEAALIKVPPSFDPRSMPGFEPSAWFGEASGDYRRVKFLLLRRNNSAATPKKP